MIREENPRAPVFETDALDKWLRHERPSKRLAEAADSRPVPITAQDVEVIVKDREKTLPAAHVLDACYSEAFLHAFDSAAARNDARLIGQLYMAARLQLARKLAHRELHGRDEQITPSDDQVVSTVFVNATSAVDRRRA
jgi:hypothetical protein